MGRGKHDPQTTAAQRQVEQNQRVERRKAVGDNAVGKGEKPGFGTGAWAKQNDLFKEGDTEGPATK